jgi:hypothetical protein
MSVIADWSAGDRRWVRARPQMGQRGIGNGCEREQPREWVKAVSRLGERAIADGHVRDRRWVSVKSQMGMCASASAAAAAYWREKLASNCVM